MSSQPVPALPDAARAPSIKALMGRFGWTWEFADLVATAALDAFVGTCEVREELGFSGGDYGAGWMPSLWLVRRDDAEAVVASRKANGWPAAMQQVLRRLVLTTPGEVDPRAEGPHLGKDAPESTSEN